MYYHRTEEYNFIVPKEHNAYLSFKKQLKDANIEFSEDGGSRYQTITIHIRGNFDNPGEIYNK